MATTVGFQRRTVRSLDGTAEYVVETFIDERGELPDKGAFLLEILDSADPSRDSLARISNVADFTDFGTDRITAVAGDDRFFRAAVATNIYTNVDVALAAAGIIQDNVNLLVNAYQTFNEDFSTLGLLGPPVDYAQLDWPLIADTLKERLISEYTTIKTARVSKEEEIATQEASCAALSLSLASLEDDKSLLLEVQGALSGLTAAISSSVVSFNTAFTQGEALSAGLPAGFAAYETDITNLDIGGGALDPGGSGDWFRDPDPTAAGETDEGSVPLLMRTANDGFIAGRASLADLGTKSSLVSQKAALIDGLLASKDTEISTARTTSETCANDLIVLSTELQTLENEEAQALTAVLAICPDFDETTV